MKKNYVGSIIKTLRTQNKMTQSKLSEGLCTIRQLSRIENNQSSPTIVLLSEFFHRLGHDLFEYLPYADDPKGYQLKNSIESLYQLYQAGQHQSMEAILDKFRVDDIISSHAKKEILWFKGIITYYLSNPGQVSIDYYKKILIDDYKLDHFNQVMRLNLKVIDFQIINTIIVKHLEQEEFDLAYQLLEDSIQSYEQNQVSTRGSVYHRFIFNLSRLHYKDCHYQEAASLSKKGIDHLKKIGSLYYLADLCSLYGRSMFMLGHEQEGKQYIQTYIAIKGITNPDLPKDIVEALTSTFNLNS